MARVTITELARGDTASAANVNSTMSSWTTQSTAIDEQNVREEGLDRRSITARVITPDNGAPTYGQSNAFTQAYAAYTLVVDGSAANIVIGTVTYDRTNADQLIVRVAGAVTSTAATLQVRLAYSTDYNPATGLGTWTALSETERQMTVAAATAAELRTNFCIAHVFDEGGLTFSSSTLYFGLFANCGGANVTFDSITFFARLFSR